MTQTVQRTSSLVLVVEDDVATRLAMARLVRMCGHKALLAETVSEGLLQLAHNPTHVFLDMNLPDGKGTTILLHIRANGMTTQVAVISDTDDHHLLEEARSLLADVIFSKPADADAVMAWINS